MIKNGKYFLALFFSCSSLASSAQNILAPLNNAPGEHRLKSEGAYLFEGRVVSVKKEGDQVIQAIEVHRVLKGNLQPGLVLVRKNRPPHPHGDRFKQPHHHCHDGDLNRKFEHKHHHHHDRGHHHHRGGNHHHHRGGDHHGFMPKQFSGLFLTQSSPETESFGTVANELREKDKFVNPVRMEMVEHHRYDIYDRGEVYGDSTVFGMKHAYPNFDGMRFPGVDSLYRYLNQTYSGLKSDDFSAHYAPPEPKLYQAPQHADRMKHQRDGKGNNKPNGRMYGNSSANALSFRAYPNPATEVVNISAYLPQSGVFSVELLDLEGKKVADFISETSLPAGIFTKEVDLKGIAAGTYLCRFKSGSEIQTQRLIIVK